MPDQPNPLEHAARIAELRRRLLSGETLNMEDLKDVLSSLRANRRADATTSAASKGPKAPKVSGEQLLNQILGGKKPNGGTP
jgi:hypothetical protein